MKKSPEQQTLDHPFIEQQPYEKLWLSLYFYQLPLDIFTSERATRKNNEQIEVPFAVIENSKLTYCNLVAQTHGLDNNMKVATAYALCADLKVKPRNLLLENKRLLELANIAYKFTSQVCLYNNKTILLEVSGSCKLFSQLTNLLTQLNRQLNLTAVNYYVAIAETPKKAFLLSIVYQKTLSQLIQETNQKNIKQNIQISKLQLKKIPIDFIAQDSFSHKDSFTHKELGKINQKTNLKNIAFKVKKMGVKSIGDLLNLPDSALGRRFGSMFLSYLYRLKGRMEDPLELYTIADSFSIQRCFLSGLDTVEQILFPTRPMLESLVLFLTARRKMANEITWRFECFNGKELTIKILLSSQVQSTQNLMALTRLKLQQINIEDKVEMLFLDAKNFSYKKEKQKTLEFSDFSNTQHQRLNYNEKEAFEYLKDKIGARLKNENYFKLLIHDEYLPEKRSTLNFANESYKSMADIKTPNTLKEKKERPLWLMDDISTVKILSNNNIQTNPLNLNSIHINSIHINCREPLTIESIAEKIESHWWNEKPSINFQDKCKQANKSIKGTCRDYYVAKSKQGSRYWVFFDQYQKQWFVHGIF